MQADIVGKLRKLALAEKRERFRERVKRDGVRWRWLRLYGGSPAIGVSIFRSGQGRKGKRKARLRMAGLCV